MYLEKTENLDKIEEKTVYVNIALVMPDKNQPRKEFDEVALKELAESIKQYGIISPIIARKRDDFYQIIAGERRWRAARLAGLKEVPIIVREYEDQIATEISILENIQREDLNPIEEARAYKRLMEEFSLTQEQIAERLSKTRVVVANSLRLLNLDDRVQDMLMKKSISAGHAKALAGLHDKELEFELANKIIINNLTVRDIERLIAGLDKKKLSRKDINDGAYLDAFYEDLINKTIESLGTRVVINRKDKNKGEIKISFNSLEELEMITDKLRRGLV